MEHANVLHGIEARPSHYSQRLLLSYSIAVAATSACGFLYLYAAKRIAVNDSASGLDAVVGLYWTAGMLAPIAVVLKGLFLASAIWGILLLLDAPAAFARCLETVWLAELLLAAPQAIFAVAALVRGANAKSQLYVPLGLDLIWAPVDLPQALLTHAVNIFLLAWGIFVFTRLSARDEAYGKRARVALAAALVSALVVILPIVQLT